MSLAYGSHHIDIIAVFMVIISTIWCLPRVIVSVAYMPEKTDQEELTLFRGKLARWLASKTLQEYASPALLYNYIALVNCPYKLQPCLRLKTWRRSEAVPCGTIRLLWLCLTCSLVEEPRISSKNEKQHLIFIVISMWMKLSPGPDDKRGRPDDDQWERRLHLHWSSSSTSW